MDLTQIRYFLALARTLNFTRAAEACNVTQPALTKSIQRLEDELGGPLLLRERSLTQLTALGQAMLPLLEQTHEAAARAKEHAAGMKRQTASPLRVGLATDVPTSPIVPVLHELSRRLPGFELHMEDAPGPGLFDALLHGTLDVAVVTGEEPLPDRLNRWSLFMDNAAIVVPPGHALDAPGAVGLDALGGAAVVLGGPGCAMERLLDLAAREHGVRPAGRHQAGTAQRAADLVRAGFGVGWSSDRADAPAGLRKRPVDGGKHEVVLVAVAGHPFSRAADAFIKLARARDWPGAA